MELHARLCAIVFVLTVGSVAEASPSEVHTLRDNAVAAARRGDWAPALQHIERAIELAPRWADSYFVRSGILVNLSLGEVFDLAEAARGRPYALAAEHARCAIEDLRRYLSLEPLAEPRDAVEQVIASLEQRVTRLEYLERTVAEWDRHEYPLDGEIYCEGVEVRPEFRVAGRPVQMLRAGTYRLQVVVPDCEPVDVDVTVPPYEPGQDKTAYVSGTFRLRSTARGGPSAVSFVAAALVALEMVQPVDARLAENAARSDSEGAPAEAVFGDELRLFGPVISVGNQVGTGPRFTTRLQFGYHVGRAGLVAYDPGTSGTGTSYQGPAVDTSLRLAQFGAFIGVRIPLGRAGVRLEAGFLRDHWSVDDDRFPLGGTMLRLPLSVGLELMRSCDWRLAGWAQWSPALADGLDGVDAVTVGFGVQRSFMCSGGPSSQPGRATFLMHRPR